MGLHAKTQGIMPSKINKRKEWQKREKKEKKKWTEKTWPKLVMETLKEGAKVGWAKEIARRGDMGACMLKNKQLCQAKYIKGWNGNDIRAEIKERIEWGKHWVKEDQ